MDIFPWYEQIAQQIEIIFDTFIVCQVDATPVKGRSREDLEDSLPAMSL